MLVYRMEIPPGVAEVVRRLPPELKQAVKAAIRAIAHDPAAGEPLQGELRGWFKYRGRRFRVVYRIDRSSRIVRLMAVGHRSNVYDELGRLSRGAK